MESLYKNISNLCSTAVPKSVNGIHSNIYVLYVFFSSGNPL